MAFETIAFADARQGGMIRRGLEEIIPDVPSQGEPVGHDLHELPLGAQILEEKDQLQLKKDHGSTPGRPEGA